MAELDRSRHVLVVLSRRDLEAQDADLEPVIVDPVTVPGGPAEEPTP
jgi:hypothetical protein